MSNASFKKFAADMAKGIYEGVGQEFSFALDDIRHKVVEQGWFGHPTTPEAVDFYRWLGADKAAPEQAAAAKDEIEAPAIEIEPMEGRPSNLDERLSEAVAYARHKEAGPFGTMEMDDAHSHEWREFEEWVDKPNELTPGQGDAEREKALEPEYNAPER